MGGTPFGSYEVRLDPWQVEYGGEVPALPASGGAEPDETVDLGVEVEPGAWAPVLAPDVSEGGADPEGPTRLVFVDGVRRVETRVVARHRDERGGEVLCHGAFGSYGVGSVVVEGGHATFGPYRVDRVVALTAGERLPGPVRVGPALIYRPVATESTEVDAPIRAVHDEMRRAEERLALELAGDESTLVVCDGPLTFGHPTRGAAVGCIKRISSLHLSGAHLALLAKLPARTRTPVFTLGGSKRFARYSWFLRLDAPRPGDSELSGLVRMEVAQSVGRERAVKLAGACCHALPAFRAVRGLHPRAPQNLLPIGALESRLRRELGDQRLIHRLIHALITEEAKNA